MPGCEDCTREHLPITDARPPHQVIRIGIGQATKEALEHNSIPVPFQTDMCVRVME